MLDASEVKEIDQWTKTFEGHIQVLKDTKQAHLNALVKLNEEDRMGSKEWYERLADLRTVNAELKYLNQGD